MLYNKLNHLKFLFGDNMIEKIIKELTRKGYKIHEAIIISEPVPSKFEYIKIKMHILNNDVVVKVYSSRKRKEMKFKVSEKVINEIDKFIKDFIHEIDEERMIAWSDLASAVAFEYLRGN